MFSDASGLSTVAHKIGWRKGLHEDCLGRHHVILPGDTPQGPTTDSKTCLSAIEGTATERDILMAPPNVSPFHDLPHCVEVAKSFVIATTPRTGSSLICSALWKSGIAGAPNEYLNPMYRTPLERRWATSSDQEFFLSLFRHRTSANGVFGLKAHYFQIEASGEILSYLPQPVTFFHLRRTDVIAQAVSLELARQRDLWSTLQSPSTVQAVYSRDRLERRVIQIEAGNRGWEKLFEDRRIRPVQLRYEELASDWRASITRVLDALQVRYRTSDLLEPPLERLSDYVNEDWIDRFRRGA